MDAALKDILASQASTLLYALDCSKITNEQFIKVGDAIMAPVTGDETHHSAMENLKGGEESTTTRAMHTMMGKAYLSCSPGLIETEGSSGMGGMGNSSMNMMTGSGMIGTSSVDIMNLITVKRSPTLGDYFVDSHGMTLYTYANDTLGVSNCDASCAAAWPPYATAQKPEDFSMMYLNLGMSMRKDGSFQFTWKGLPLYYFKSDTKAGETNGEGLNGAWHVVHQ